MTKKVIVETTEAYTFNESEEMNAHCTISQYIDRFMDGNIEGLAIELVKSRSLIRSDEDSVRYVFRFSYRTTEE